MWEVTSLAAVLWLWWGRGRSCFAQHSHSQWCPLRWLLTYSIRKGCAILRQKRKRREVFGGTGEIDPRACE
jgi:hypothetical protein